jgi:hypothetical protein
VILTDDALAVAALCRVYLRAPIVTGQDEQTGAMAFGFEPPLTSAEQTTFDQIVRMARSHVTGLSLAEFTALQPVLTSIRANRTRSDAQWTALTAAQRDTQLIAWCRDLTDVLRALLRD